MNGVAETDAAKIIRFITSYCLTPEGSQVGKPIILAPFQIEFIEDTYNNADITRRSIMSIARKNGKSALIACLLLAHICGPMRQKNSQIVSGAQSRDQAALVFELASKIINMSPALQQVTKIVPSQKTIIGLKDNVTYRALSADGTTAHGLSPTLIIIDEPGQVKGTTTPFLEALMTSQGAHENPLQIFISTQSPNDADFFSLMIDDAIRSGDPKTICHVYQADADSELMDKEQWAKANPALGLFRNEKDLEEQLKQASRLPSLEGSARNLLLNQRVSAEKLAFAPTIIKENNGESDWQVFRENPVHAGLDLSKVNDLTACVLCAEDENGIIHVKTLAFTPLGGIKERSLRDRVPYDTWADQDILYAPPGKTLDYDMISTYLQMLCEEQGIVISSIHFDRWRAKDFFASCERTGFASLAEQKEVGQGYQSISPRLEALETALLQNRLLCDNHPVLNMGFAAAIVQSDPAGNRKLDKRKENGPKIDAVIALLMAAFPLINKEEALGEDLSHWIG